MFDVRRFFEDPALHQPSIKAALIPAKKNWGLRERLEQNLRTAYAIPADFRGPPISKLPTIPARILFWAALGHGSSASARSSDTFFPWEACRAFCRAFWVEGLWRVRCRQPPVGLEQLADVLDFADCTYCGSTEQASGDEIRSIAASLLGAYCQRRFVPPRTDHFCHDLPDSEVDFINVYRRLDT
jgi:hypothetical protein